LVSKLIRLEEDLRIIVSQVLLTQENREALIWENPNFNSQILKFSNSRIPKYKNKFVLSFNTL